MLCRQGPSERYAPLGLSFPPLPRRVPSHEAADGYAAPTAPAGQPCLDDELFPCLTTPIRHWPKLKNAAWYCGKLRCLSKTWLHLRDKSTRILWDIHGVWTRALWFSTLLATAVMYYILTIRKSADSTNVKRQVQKGVLAWAFGRPIHIIYWHTISYRQKKQNQQMSRGSKTIHILENITGSKTIHIVKNRSLFCNNIVTWKK